MREPTAICHLVEAGRVPNDLLQVTPVLAPTAENHCQAKCLLPSAAGMNYNTVHGWGYTTVFTGGSVRALHDRYQ